MRVSPVGEAVPTVGFANANVGFPDGLAHQAGLTQISQASTTLQVRFDEKFPPRRGARRAGWVDLRSSLLSFKVEYYYLSKLSML